MAAGDRPPPGLGERSPSAYGDTPDWVPIVADRVTVPDERAVPHEPTASHEPPASGEPAASEPSRLPALPAPFDNLLELASRIEARQRRAEQHLSVAGPSDRRAEVITHGGSRPTRPRLLPAEPVVPPAFRSSTTVLLPEPVPPPPIEHSHRTSTTTLAAVAAFLLILIVILIAFGDRLEEKIRATPSVEDRAAVRPTDDDLTSVPSPPAAPVTTTGEDKPEQPDEAEVLGTQQECAESTEGPWVQGFEGLASVAITGERCSGGYAAVTLVGPLDAPAEAQVPLEVALRWGESGWEVLAYGPVLDCAALHASVDAGFPADLCQ